MSTKVKNISLIKGLEAVIIDNLGQLDKYASRWNDLALRAPQKIPTLSFAWISAYIKHRLPDNTSWKCILILSGQELVGVLPIIRKSRNLIGFSKKEIFPPYDYHTFSVEFLSRVNIESSVINEILSVIREQETSGYFIHLGRIPGESPTLSALKSIPKELYYISEYDGKGSYLKIEGEFADYYSKLGSNFRRNLKKASNKFDKIPNVRLEILSGREASPDFLEQFMKVESSGWKGEKGSAIIMSESLRNYYSELVKNLYELNWLEWHLLYLDNQVISGHFAVRMGRNLILVKIGYDENFKNLSPGSHLMEHVIKSAFENHDTDEINCLSDMPWHDNWNMQKRDYYNITMYPRQLIPMIFGAMQLNAKILLKKLYKRFNFMKHEDQSASNVHRKK